MGSLFGHFECLFFCVTEIHTYIGTHSRYVLGNFKERFALIKVHKYLIIIQRYTSCRVIKMFSVAGGIIIKYRTY